jgi:aspartyl protease
MPSNDSSASPARVQQWVWPINQSRGARGAFVKHVAFAIVLLSCVLASNTPSRASAPQRGAAAAVSIPFELATHHVIVKAQVNGSRPLSFLLDTGANVAIVRMDTARELGLSLHGNVNARGAGAGTQAGSRVSNAAWSLVGLEGFSQPVAFALPLPELPASLGRHIDGIIGGEFIGQFVLEVDYQARRLTLHDRKTFVYRGSGQTLPIEFTSNGHPVVQATVTPLNRAPIAHRFLLDLGSGQALVLHSPFAAEQRLPGPESNTIPAIGGYGAGGRVAGRLGRVAALQIGTFTIGSPITLFLEDTGGSFADRSLAGNIGAQIASRFRMFLDYAGRRIILEPSPAYAEPFDRAFSGLAVRAEGPDYRTFRVREVLENSPAADAGLHAARIET